MPHYVNVALGCFFSGTSGYGGGGWSTLRLFALEGWQGSKPPQVRGWLCALCALGCKKCDRKKQQKGWLCGSLKKDRASPERFILSEGRGFF